MTRTQSGMLMVLLVFIVIGLAVEMRKLWRGE